MKLTNGDAKQYPKLMKYLKDEFPAILKKDTILKGLTETGIDYRDAVIYTTYGYDPLVDIKPILNGKPGGWKVTSSWDGVPQTHGIQISTTLVKAFNKDDDYVTFANAGTMRMIDAVLVLMLVGWRKIAETGGIVSSEETHKAVFDFYKKHLGEKQALVNPFR